MNDCYRAAWAYKKRGWHPIPLAGKSPLVSWKVYQEQQPTGAEIDSWWTKWPDANVGLVTGRGLFVVDVDGPEATSFMAPYLTPTAVVRTGRVDGGAHFYYLGNATNSQGAIHPKVDVRGDGGFVVAPPSIHPDTGLKYAGLTEGVSQAPGKLLELIAQHKQKPAREHVYGDCPGGQELLDAFDAKGWLGDEIADGVFAVTCPWDASHASEGSPSKTVLFTNDAAGPGFDCKSGGCAAANGGARRSIQDVRDFFGLVPVERSGGDELIEFIEQLLTPDRPKRVVATSLGKLDKQLNGGLYPGIATYWAGVGGVGKSITAQMVAIEAALRGEEVFYASLEEPPVDVMARVLAFFTGIDSRKIMAILHGQEQADDFYRNCFKGAIAQVKDLPLVIRQNVPTVAAIERALEKRPNVRLLVVDQLQHLRHAEGLSGMHGLEENSRALVELAGRHDIPVLGICQVNRPQDRRPDWRPNRYSLRGSEQLYHDAAVVLLFHRADDHADRLEIQVNKARMGGASPEWFNFKYSPEVCRVE